MCVIAQRLKYYLLLMRFHRPIGIFLLLWPMLWSLWIASHGHPNYLVLCVFVLGVILMRAAGCVINDFADRKIDPHVARTHMRPIACGLVSAKEALMLFFVLIIAAFFLVLLMNRLTILLAFVAAAIAIIYPFTKRFFILPQLVLGLAWAMSVPMVFAAQIHTVPPVAWFIFLITLIWTFIFDTQYAMADREEDLKIGIQSAAIFLGRWDLIVIFLLQALMVFLLIILGKWLNLNLSFYVAVIIAALLMVYQAKLIRHRDSRECFKAFLNNNWVGLVIFLGIAINHSNWIN